MFDSSNLPSTHSSLIARLLDPVRDERAWRVFLEGYQPSIHAWTKQHGLQDADADDVVQTVITKVFRKLSTYSKARGGFRNWLYVITDNTVKDVCRQQRGHTHGTGDPAIAKIIDSAPASDALVVSIHEMLVRNLVLVAEHQLWKALIRERKLDEWEIYRMRMKENLSFDEIAVRVNRTRGAVAVAFHRTVKKLRNIAASLHERSGD